MKTRVQRDALSGVAPRDSALAIFRDRLAGGVGKLCASYSLGLTDPASDRGLGVSVIRAALNHGITWSLIESITEGIDREFRARGGV